jgi:O-antigen/teichoic acid export membrane protein
MLTQRKKVGLNVIWLSADKLSRMAIALLVGVLVARYLGPVRYGTLNYALALVSLVSAVVALGLDNIIVRDATKEPERVGTIIATGFVLKLLAGLAGGLALIIYYCLVHKGDDTARAVVLIVSLMLPLQVFDAFDFLFQSRIKAQYTVASRLFAFMATSIIKIWLMWAGAPLTAFALMSTLESALIAVGFLVAVNLYGDKISHWRASRSEAIKLLSNSWPLMLSSLAIVIYLRVDQVFGNEILGNRAEGVYAAAVKVAELWNFLPTMICASCFPVIISAKQSDQRKYILRLRQLYGVIGIVTIVPALITSLYAGLLIKVLYRAKYAGAAQILSVYAWA